MQEPINILLVDDERRNLDSLEAVLAEPGYRLLRAEDADKALRLLLEHDVAAIVLDIKMPGVSGFDLARLIKGSKKFREIPIVFLTGQMLDDQDVLAGYGAGAVDYLMKPVNPLILRHKVAVFADLFRKTRALAELNEHLEQRVQERTAELERSESALRDANQHKDAFLAMLAHELRNPLAPLRTGVGVLQHTLPSAPESATRLLDMMNRQLDHMVRLIDDLLDVSRISRGVLALQKAPADLGRVIERAVETVAPFIERRRQTLTIHTKVPVTAVVDATRVAQVVGNLLHNASKFTPVGGQIIVELDSRDSAAIVRVIDRGAGIDREHLERVFGMFATVDRATSNATGGLGIGLALARHLAHLHGGTLTAESGGEGQGSTFSLILPVGAIVTSVAPNFTEGAAASGHNQSDTLDVVIIEDNDDAADSLTVWLEDVGHRVRVARTGLEGVALVLDAQPDVVLCDLGLPGIDGLEVCRRVRASMSTQPVMIALTGWGADADRRRSREAGFDHHLVKPVTTEVLSALLRTVAEAAATGEPATP